MDFKRKESFLPCSNQVYCQSIVPLIQTNNVQNTLSPVSDYN